MKPHEVRETQRPEREVVRAVLAAFRNSPKNERMPPFSNVGR